MRLCFLLPALTSLAPSKNLTALLKSAVIANLISLFSSSIINCLPVFGEFDIRFYEGTVVLI